MQFPKPNFEWSGTKFRQRYGLGEFDFWDNGQGFVVLKNGIVLPDDPPIFEAPDPPQPQGTLKWINGPIPNTVRLVAEFNGKSCSIVVAGQDTTDYTMYVSPGPMIGQEGRAKRYHIEDISTIGALVPPPTEGDTLHIGNDGVYHFTQGQWARILTGPLQGSPADQVDLYADLNAKLDAAINPPQGPQIDSRIKAVLVELRKLI